MRSALSPTQRAAAIEALDGNEVDVLVIGGGIVGAGAALDAVTRGLSTAVLEARDWASGTSGRSSGLIHGGLRYLEMLDFGLVREALRERSLLSGHIAPYLIKPVSFLYPLTHRGWERPYVGAGVLLYDTLGLAFGSSARLPRHRHLSKRGALREAACLRPDSLVGAVKYWDTQVDDARYALTVVRTAVGFGAHAANRARVVELMREGTSVVGARVLDTESGRQFTVRSKQVINATGVWSDRTQQLAGADGPFSVRASKGIHLVVPKDRIDASTGLILRTDVSVLFVIPRGEHWIIGTTDTDWEHDLDDPSANAKDIDYLLDEVNSVLAVPLSREDIEAVYVGLRPLLSGASEATARLSREHAVSRPAPGLVAVAGGKYTTYRLMAADALDEAVRGLDADVPASCTASIPLVGADGWRGLRNQARELAATAKLPVDTMTHLLGKYGTSIHDLLDLMAERPELRAPIPGGAGYLAAEVTYAVTHEGARHVEDVLTRRTRISLESGDGGVHAAGFVAGLMAPLLGWDQDRAEAQVQDYRAAVAAERRANEQFDDATADRARRSAAGVAAAGHAR